MRRPFLLGLLAFGTVAGYASGFHHLRGGCHRGGCDRESWSDSRRFDAEPAAVAAPAAPTPAPVVINAAPAPAPQPMQALIIPIVINPGAPGAAATPAQPIVVTLPIQAVAASPAAAPAAVHP